MPARMEPKLIAGFLVVLLAIIANVFVASANMDIVSSNRKGVAHTHQVMAELETTLSAFKDAETGERGYVITGRLEYLQPYEQAHQEIEAHIANLRRLTADNPQQQQNIAELEGLKQPYMALLQKVIEARRTQEEAAARQILIKGENKARMDAIRALTARMNALEEKLLADRRQESEASERRARLTFYGATAVGMALLFMTFVLVARAFAERKRVAEAIQKREEWLSTTLRSIGDAVIATDEQGQVLFMNGIAEDLTGWKQQEAEGRNAREVFHIVNEETGAEVDSPIEKAIEHGIIVGLANHTVLIAKEGTERPIEDSGAPIRDLQGKLVGVVLVFRDVSDRRQHEIEHEAYVAELAQLNERLRRAMTETHHRVKNNLQVVAALIEMQEQSAAEMVPMSILVRLRQNIQAMAVIHDLLTEQSKEEGDTRSVSTRGVLERLAPILRATLGTRRLQAQIEDLSLLTKQTTALALIANELISNASKHGRGDIDLTLRKERAQVVLEVRDDGPGFPEGFRPEMASSTGLELIESIARFDLHGETAYRNRPEGGAVVRVTFPA